MSIVCLGDSLTYGYGLSPSQSWVSQLAELYHLELINKGVPGDTTLDMKHRFHQDVLACHPSQFLLMGGTNDLFIGRSIEETLMTLKEIIALCQSHDLPVIVLTPLPINEQVRVKYLFSGADYHEVNQSLAELGNQLITFCNAHHLPCINIGGAVNALKDKEDFYLRDGIHVNAEIYTLIAHTIFESKLL